MNDKYAKYREHNLHSIVAEKHPEINKHDLYRRTLEVIEKAKNECNPLRVFKVPNTSKTQEQRDTFVEEKVPDGMLEVSTQPEILETKTDEAPEVETIETETQEIEVLTAQELENQETQDFGDYELLIDTDKVNKVSTVTGIKPIGFAGDVVIPNGITSIGKYAFMGSRFRSIKLPNSLCYLGEGCFMNSCITEIQLPKKVDAIPHRCFDGSKLNKINFENIKSIGNKSFRGTNIKEVTLVQDIEQIGIEAFMKCISLVSFKHKPTLKKIRSYAFSGCESLLNFDFVLMIYYNLS